MTLNAQTFIAGTAQVEFKQRPVTGVVTRVTGHRATIPRVVCRITGRVTEVVVIFMTGETTFVPRSLEHCRFSGTMQLVAVKTTLGMGVQVKIVFPPVKLSSMAVAADLPGITTHQPCLLTGVRRMAVKAE
jgi:hypothetical protein